MQPSLAFRAVVVVLLIAALAPPVAAEPQYIDLGTDPEGDNQVQSGQGGGVLHVTDIVGARIATDNGELLFHMLLPGTSEPGGSYCWALGFEADGAEMFPVVCAEFAGGQHVAQIGWTTGVESSRGAQVPEATGEFVADGIVLHIPLDAAGLSMGEAIHDIYALTYNTRALNLADTMPDAKSDRAAAENLGSYVIGSSSVSGGTDTPIEYRVLDGPLTAKETSTSPTNKTIQYNWTATASRGTFQLDGKVTAGQAIVKVLDGGNATLYSTVLNATRSDTKEISGAAGMWRIQVQLQGFQGEYSFNFDPVETTVTTTTGSATSTTSSGQSTSSETGKTSPAFGLIAAVSVLGVALAMRRRA